MDIIKFSDYFETLKDKENSYKIRDEVNIKHYFSEHLFDHLEVNSSIYFTGIEIIDLFKYVKFRNINIYFNDIKTVPTLNISGENCNIYFDRVKGSPKDLFIDYEDYFNLELRGSFNTIQLFRVKYEKIRISIEGSIIDLCIEKCIFDYLSICGSLYDKIELLTLTDINPMELIKEIKVDVVPINYIKFIKLTSLNKLLINKVKIQKKLLIISSTIKSVEFQNYMANNLCMINCTISELFIDIKDIPYLDQGIRKYIQYNIKKIISKNTKINFLEINQSNNLEIVEINLTSIDKLKISNLKCNTFNLNNNISLESNIFGCIFQNLVFKDFYSSSLLNIKNTQLKKENNHLNINNSNLDNVLISPSFFEELKKISFTKSSIQGLKITNFIDIPLKTINPNNKDKNTNYLILFREFKNLAKNYGDNYLYHKFKALEYNERLKREINLFDRSVLQFNKFTNNHTTDWFKAFKLLIILFTFNLSIITSYLYNSYDNFNVLDIAKLLPYLLSPVSFLVNYKEYEFHNVIYLFDFLYNIGIGLIIYQMIAAFRKFNR
ncbi:hypothetical protein [Cyclobacterium qasimii]|uniref:Uncharacterized protein n=1 Tax=Cyclobacterium qasimii TaxID=1350429 RepID=A0A512CDW2_9BACT|nr:hypothetical protein [Cyclobacterium qasimii]GEO22387.1 hypothetical protein CQA01_29210 [Cyclobacterium qasimii]